MAGCGYVCPVCEGRGYSDEGKTCTFCSVPLNVSFSDEEWIKSVHDNCVCSDIGKSEHTETNMKSNF